MRNTLPTSNADIGLGSQSSSWLGGLRIDNMPSLHSISNFASRSMGHGSNLGLPTFNARATQRRSSFNSEKSSPLPNPATSPTFNRSANPLLSPIFTVPQQATSAVRQALSNTNSVSFTPDTIKFVLLCILWYTSSAVTNNTGKQIMNVFRFPLTLTFVQFGFVSGYCFIWANVFGFGRIKYPTRQVIETTMPLSLFQVAGHIFSSLAIARVPVSFVHTIKALSPLFTVMAYGLMFNVRYSLRTYISLIPLTLGVMLACSFSSFQSTSNFVGFVCALGSTLIFVSQNIFSKRLLFGDTRAASHRRVKLDKINLLFYSSGMAFLLMIPIWLWYDGYTLVSTGFALTAHHSGTSIPLRFIINGSAHWGQNVIAFSILAITSTVTYSIASLVKRIFVIVASIIWFGQSTTFVQGLGITLTFIGLYMYQQAKTDVDRGERAMRKAEVQNEALLPMNAGEQRDDVMRETKITRMDKTRTVTRMDMPRIMAMGTLPDWIVKGIKMAMRMDSGTEW